MYSIEIINLFFAGQVPWPVENFKIGINTDTINATNFKFCVMVLLIDCYLLIALSVILNIFQGHNNVEQF